MAPLVPVCFAVKVGADLTGRRLGGLCHVERNCSSYRRCGEILKTREGLNYRAIEAAGSMKKFETGAAEFAESMNIVGWLVRVGLLLYSVYEAQIISDIFCRITIYQKQ